MLWQRRPVMQNAFSAMLKPWLTPDVFVADGGVEGDLPLSLHHMAWLWRPRISCLLPQFSLQGSGVWLIGLRAWALSGALQCWDWTLRDLCLGGHLPGPGEEMEYGGGLREYHQIHWQLKRNVAEKHQVLLLKRVKLWQDGKMRCDYTEWWIQGETLWHVGTLNSRNNCRL